MAIDITEELNKIREEAKRKAEFEEFVKQSEIDEVFIEARDAGI